MIKIDMAKAKVIAHEARRAARAAEFEPLDAVIMKQIPGNNPAAVEAERLKIREKYAALQDQMNAAQTPDELKALMP